MKRIAAVVALVGVLLAAAPPAEAAGCIAGAIVGGTAAHVTDHNRLLGAIGGCIVGRMAANALDASSYSDVTGRMLGSDAALRKVEAAHTINIVKLSALRGYEANDSAVQAEIAASRAVHNLQARIAANPDLTDALAQQGFAPTDAIAVDSTFLTGAIVYVNA